MILTGAALAAAAAAGPEPAGCRAVAFDAEIVARQSYAHAIGGGLEVRLTPQQFADPAAQGRRLDGWEVAVTVTPEPASGGAPVQDRIWPANPPLRFNPSQQIGTSYGVTAAQKLSREISYRFLWRAADYERIAKLASDALWPYSAPDPNHAGALYLAGLQTVEAAELRLHPRHYELTEQGLGIRRLSLTITATAPAGFSFPDRLAAKPAACPPKQE